MKMLLCVLTVGGVHATMGLVDDKCDEHDLASLHWPVVASKTSSPLPCEVPLLQRHHSAHGGELPSLMGHLSATASGLVSGERDSATRRSDTPAAIACDGCH